MSTFYSESEQLAKVKQLSELNESRDDPDSYDTNDDTVEDAPVDATVVSANGKEPVAAFDDVDFDRELRNLSLRQCETNPNRRRLEFNDIEFTLQKFTGDDNYRVKKWIADYEEILASGFVEERDKLIYARRLMDGTAKKMLITVSAANWNDLKSHLYVNSTKTSLVEICMPN